MQTVPAKLMRYGLSQVVNHLLALGADLATGRERLALGPKVVCASSVDCYRRAAVATTDIHTWGWDIVPAALLLAAVGDSLSAATHTVLHTLTVRGACRPAPGI